MLEQNLRPPHPHMLRNPEPFVFQSSDTSNGGLQACNACINTAVPKFEQRARTQRFDRAPNLGQVGKPQAPSHIVIQPTAKLPARQSSHRQLKSGLTFLKLLAHRSEERRV